MKTARNIVSSTQREVRCVFDSPTIQCRENFKSKTKIFHSKLPAENVFFCVMRMMLLMLTASLIRLLMLISCFVEQHR